MQWLITQSFLKIYLKIFSDNGIIPEEEFSHTILIIKYSKQKKLNFDELTWFPHCPTEKKNGK